jgi:hypothetical protein
MSTDDSRRSMYCFRTCYEYGVGFVLRMVADIGVMG